MPEKRLSMHKIYEVALLGKVQFQITSYKSM